MTFGFELLKQASLPFIQLTHRINPWTPHYNICGYERIYHIHIRKSGGTSLNQMFLRLATNDEEGLYKNLAEIKGHRLMENGKIFVGWNKNYINLGGYFYAFSHTPLHELRLPPKTFTITVLRDPVKRVLSHYSMLVEYRNNNTNPRVMEHEGNWLGNSFDDFLERIPRDHLLRQIYMFSKKYEINEAYERIMACSHYMFTEDFRTGISGLNSKLDIQLISTHIRKTTYKPLITDSQISRLREMLAVEYDLIDRIQKTLENQIGKKT